MHAIAVSHSCESWTSDVEAALVGKSCNLRRSGFPAESNSWGAILRRAWSTCAVRRVSRQAKAPIVELHISQVTSTRSYVRLLYIILWTTDRYTRLHGYFAHQESCFTMHHVQTF